MRMQWRFWRGGDHKKDRKEGTTAVAQPLEHGPGALPPLPQSSTVKEILGLQQLIGNQAVLQILVLRKRNENATRTLS
jgi:hypothetical protein